MYSQIFEMHAELLKALANSSRLEIINLLRDGELCVSDIHSMLDLPQAHVSQHLMQLRDAGIVDTRKEGKQVFYQLTDEKILQACDLIREVLIKQHHNSAIANELHLHLSDLVPIVHDPVCKMRISPKTAGSSFRHQGKIYYFCASGCAKKFEENPMEFLCINDEPRKVRVNAN